mgnify:CR=1 FL=1
MARRRTVDTWKNKRWYSIIAPKIFKNVEFGYTPADDENKVIGRTVETTLHQITKDFRQRHIILKFKIFNVENDKAYTKFVGHRLTREYVRSKVRRGKTRVDSIDDVRTKDNYLVRVKAFLLTNKRAKTSREKEIRARLSEYVNMKAKETSFEEFVQAMIFGKYVDELKDICGDIWPIARVEFRKSEVLEEPANSS